jgi:hypothetical protein
MPSGSAAERPDSLGHWWSLVKEQTVSSPAVGAEVPREAADGAYFFPGGSGNIRHRHRKFTGEEHGGQSLTHLANHLLCDRTTGQTLLALAAVQSGPHLAHQTIHSRDGEVPIDGERGAQMFDHLIAFVGLGCKQELDEDSSSMGLLARRVAASGRVWDYCVSWPVAAYNASAHCGPVADGSPIARLPLGSIQIPFRAHNTYKGGCVRTGRCYENGNFFCGRLAGNR